MASFARPSVLRQLCNAAPAQRGLSTAVRPTTAAFVQRSAIRDALPKATRVAAFHATSRQQILPPPKQVVIGTTNDAAPIPAYHPSHGSYHWSFERLVAVGLVPLTVAPFIGGSLNPIMDATLCGLLVVHSHIGFQACIIDYFPTYRVPKTHKAFMWLLRAATLGTAVGLYEFETNDIGLTAAIHKVWTA